jgi:hypothetical protein
MRKSAALLAKFFGSGITKTSRPMNEKESEKRTRHREWLEEKQRNQKRRKHENEDREEDYNGVY